MLRRVNSTAALKVNQNGRTETCQLCSPSHKKLWRSGTERICGGGSSTLMLPCLISTLDVTLGLFAAAWQPQSWPSRPLPPLSASSTQVCTIMCADAEAWMCEWGSLLLHQPSPPAFLASIGASGGCHRRSIFISIVPPSASAASLHTWKPPFPPKQLSSRTEFSPPASMNHTRRQQWRHILGWSTFLLLRSCFAGSAVATVPISHLLPHPLLSEVLREKQASCLFLLQKCLLAGQLVFHCPSGGWSCGWRQKRWPWGSCWRDWGQSSKP